MIRTGINKLELKKNNLKSKMKQKICSKIYIRVFAPLLRCETAHQIRKNKLRFEKAI
jgi:hypothetical protein